MIGSIPKGGSQVLSKGKPLAIKDQRLTALHPNPNNARTHSKRQIRQIAESIRAFGFNNPILVDRGGQIIAGHGRYAAAHLLGLEEVPTIILEDLSPDQVRAYALADNRLVEKGSWSKEILAIELQYLMTIESLDFDITITGFEIPEIDLIVGTVPVRPETAEIWEPETLRPRVSHPGDLWKLERHRVLCGNSLEDASYQTLMEAKLAAAVFTDPPYNCKIDGHATGNGEIRHREFAMASGEMSEAEFRAFLDASLSLLARYTVPGSVHYLCMDWRNIETLLSVGSDRYKNQLQNVCVWVKNTAGMGSFYRSQHEFVAVFRNGMKQHRNNVQLGRFGRNRTNVWQYPGVQTMSKRGDEGNLLELHPTVKPVQMVADALLDSTKRGDTILDPFLGSGTTLMAAERTGRSCFAIEIDPSYVDAAIRRWQKHTGSSAVNAASGESFDNIAKRGLVANEQKQ